MWGNLIGLGALGPLFGNDAQNLRDHVAGALDHHRVADARIQPFDLVFIVQGGVLHHHTAHRHRLEARHGRELAGAADLDLDIFQYRFGLFGGKFVGDGPARTSRHKTQPFLQIQPVDLVDHPVNVIAEPSALGFDVAIEFQDLFQRFTALDQRIDDEAVAFEISPACRSGSWRAAREISPQV